ncbi:MAG: helix-turn-helix domain-containing protein [Deltaproteobacteria bacterium]|nr:MAG: helix-turn-helix domain-containing protein [Deltaproteobacteria bacterium]
MRTLLTVKEVAAYLHVSTETVYRLCALGELRHIRVLNAIRMASSDVDHWYSPDGFDPEPTQLTARLAVSSVTRPRSRWTADQRVSTGRRAPSAVRLRCCSR